MTFSRVLSRRRQEQHVTPLVQAECWGYYEINCDTAGKVLTLYMDQRFLPHDWK